MTDVVRSIHVGLAAEGVDVHISAGDAGRQAIKPGDPVVVEVIARPFKADGWVEEGVGRVFESDEEEDEFFDRASAPAD
jgi:hypothetical protein